MDKISEVIKKSKKIVIKIGSNVLSNKNGQIDKERILNITKQIMELVTQGKQVVLVSSGAGIYGTYAINKWSRKNDINYKQALCAIGQVELMNQYKNSFWEHDIHVGQILLTRDDFEDDHRSLNIRNTLFTLVDEGVIPIINENDSVSVEEIKIGDNDTLSAHAANLWNADCLVILSDIDGIYDKDPKSNEDAELIELIEDIDYTVKNIKTEGKSSFGTGGVVCKINAARQVNLYGIPMVLLNGNKDNIVIKAMNGEEKGTLFCQKER